jgi:hypothetical protein
MKTLKFQVQNLLLHLNEYMYDKLHCHLCIDFMFKLLKTFIFYNKQKPELVAFMHLSKDGSTSFF